MEITLPIPVRTYDIDFAGIVSNIVYIRWLEDLRLTMLANYLPLDMQMEQGWGPVLMSTNIEYKRPIRLFDKVVGHMWVSQIGNTSYTIDAEFVANGEIATTATQRGVFVDMKSMRPVRIPDHVRQRWLSEDSTR
jgi:acyl-CoA thioester hydrolase